MWAWCNKVMIYFPNMFPTFSLLTAMGFTVSSFNLYDCSCFFFLSLNRQKKKTHQLMKHHATPPIWFTLKHIQRRHLCDSSETQTAAINSSKWINRGQTEAVLQQGPFKLSLLLGEPLVWVRWQCTNKQAGGPKHQRTLLPSICQTHSSLDTSPREKTYRGKRVNTSLKHTLTVDNGVPLWRGEKERAAADGGGTEAEGPGNKRKAE